MEQEISENFGFQKFAVTTEALLQEGILSEGTGAGSMTISERIIHFGDHVCVRKKSGTTAISNACICRDWKQKVVIRKITCCIFMKRGFSDCRSFECYGKHRLHWWVKIMRILKDMKLEWIERWNCGLPIFIKPYLPRSKQVEDITYIKIQ